MLTIPKRERTRVEKDVQNEIRQALVAMPDVTIWRNNVGMLYDRTGTPVRYGLARGSADLIGSLLVYADVRAGLTAPIARSLAIEVKMPGKKPSDAQAEWARYVVAQGWIYGVCSSVEDAVALINRARRWEL